MKFIKKTFKVVFWLLVAIVGLVLLAFLALPLWIGPAATGVANSVVPGIVKTNFRLNEFGLNQYSGSLHVGDMKLANPTNSNFTQENCVELGKFDVRLKPLSVFTKKIHIEDITLDGLLVVTTITADNFIQLAKNATGEDEAVETSAGGTQAPSSAQEAQAPAKEPAAEKVEEAAEETKVVIDRLTLKNITVKIGMVPIPLPPIVFEGIGADKPEGATLADVWEQVFTKVQSAMTAIGGALGDLGKGAINLGVDTVNALGEAGMDALKNAGDAGMDALKNAGNVGAGVLDSVGNAGGGAMKSVGEAGAGAVKAVGNVGGQTIDAVGNMGGAAIDAVGTGAGKAVEGVKDVGGAAVDAFKKLF